MADGVPLLDQRTEETIRAEGRALTSALTQQLAQEQLDDDRVWTSDKKNLEQILSLPLQWGPRIDYRAQQAQLHQRIIEELHRESDMVLRLATTEQGLRAEVKQMRAAADLQRRRAGRDEVDLTLQNLSEAADEQLSLLLLKAKKEADKILQAEKDRQGDASQDFEKEKVLAAFQRNRRDAEMRLKMTRAQRALAGNDRVPCTLHLVIRYNTPAQHKL